MRVHTLLEQASDTPESAVLRAGVFWGSIQTVLGRLEPALSWGGWLQTSPRWGPVL